MVFYEYDAQLDNLVEPRFVLSPSGCSIRDLKCEKSYDLTVDNVLRLLTLFFRLCPIDCNLALLFIFSFFV